jgi:hypothetical protein
MPVARKKPRLRIVGENTPPDRLELYARIALRAIRAELSAADFFTREDCLFLTPFQHVTTITRYTTIRLAVLQLIESGELHSISKTQLCLPSKLSRIDEGEKLHEKYMPTIAKLVRTFPPGSAITVMGVVGKWTATDKDQHLTTNAKRVAVRMALKKLAKDGLLRPDQAFGYVALRDAA